MRIAVDALLLSGQFSGVQHAILHQLRALLNRDSSHRFTIITLQETPIEECLGKTLMPYDVFRAPFSGDQRLKRIIWEQISLPEVLENAGADLLFSPGYLTCLRWQGPKVVFIHDTIALSHPHLCTYANALNYRLFLKPSARCSSLAAVPSKASGVDVARFCGIAPERIAVVPLGVNIPPTPTAREIQNARNSLGFSEPYLLAVSTIEPKKNFAQLISWFDTWKDRGIPHHLVIIGRWGWKSGNVRKALSVSRYRNDIHLTGYVPQEKLPPFMAAAEMLLVPSLYEGFGLPVLEAMAVGTPVVVSDQGALPETAGNAGVVIPLDDILWQAEIPTLLKHPDRLQKMREAGLRWSAACSWERTGELLMKVFEDVYAKHPKKATN